MSPLGKEIDRHPSGDASDLRSPLVLELLAQIQTDGFQPTLRAWCERLAARQPFDAFTRLRRDNLLDAAAAFDSTGDRDCDRFVRFVEGYTRHDAAGGKSVRVMTIHQSKGWDSMRSSFPSTQGRIVRQPRCAGNARRGNRAHGC